MSNENETKKFSLNEIAHMKTVTDDEIEKAYNDSQGIVTDYDGSEDDEAEGIAAEDIREDIVATEAFGKKKEKVPEKLAHTDNLITAEAKPTTDDMYRFMLYHSFMNATGVIALLIGAIAITMVVVSIIDRNILQIVLFSVAALLFLLNSPLSYYFKAKKNSVELCKPENMMTYNFSDAGFDISFSNDNYYPFKWEDVTKLHEGKTGFYVYTGKNRAFMVPKADLTGGNVDDFRTMAGKNVTGKLSLKYDKEQ